MFSQPPWLLAISLWPLLVLGFLPLRVMAALPLRFSQNILDTVVDLLVGIPSIPLPLILPLYGLVVVLVVSRGVLVWHSDFGTLDIFGRVFPPVPT